MRLQSMIDENEDMIYLSLCTETHSYKKLALVREGNEDRAICG